jgi:hypothetical protein
MSCILVFKNVCISVCRYVLYVASMWVILGCFTNNFDPFSQFLQVFLLYLKFCTWVQEFWFFKWFLILHVSWTWSNLGKEFSNSTITVFELGPFIHTCMLKESYYSGNWYIYMYYMYLKQNSTNYGAAKILLYTFSVSFSQSYFVLILVSCENRIWQIFHYCKWEFEAKQSI